MKTEETQLLRIEIMTDLEKRLVGMLTARERKNVLVEAARKLVQEQEEQEKHAN